MCRCKHERKLVSVGKAAAQGISSDFSRAEGKVHLCSPSDIERNFCAWLFYGNRPFKRMAPFVNTCCFWEQIIISSDKCFCAKWRLSFTCVWPWIEANSFIILQKENKNKKTKQTKNVFHTYLSRVHHSHCAPLHPAVSMGTGKPSANPDEMLGGYLWWTSIPSRGSSNTPSRFTILNTG